MDERGQTTFEYLLLLGGAVILAGIIVYLIITSGESAKSTVNESITNATAAIENKAANVINQLRSLNNP